MTELIWDGKYKDPDKKSGKVTPVRIALPFQKEYEELNPESFEELVAGVSSPT